MIERLALKTATTIKAANPEQTSSVDVLKFALIIVYGTGLTLFTSFFLSILLGSLIQTATVLFAFAFLRFFTGGFHFSSAELCSISSIAGSLVIPMIHLNSLVSFLLVVIAIILLILYAPRGINQSKYFKKKHYRILKILSIIIVSTNFLIQSDILSITFFIQALTLLFVKGGE